MRAHHFAVAEHVLYTEHRFPDILCRQSYTVVGCLDSRRTEPQYLIRSTIRPFDRVAGEDELSHEAAPMNAFLWTDAVNPSDGAGLGQPADLNLVPWPSLPRRAQHKNEQAHPARRLQP